MSTGEKLTAIAENELKVYEAGKKVFWDIYQDYGNRKEYDNAFYGWPEEVYDPQYDIVPHPDPLEAYEKSTITDTKVWVDFSRVIDEGEGVLAAVFQGSNLVTIRARFSENCYFPTSSIWLPKTLVNIICEGVIANKIVLSRPALSIDAMRNVVNILADLNGTGKSLKITLGATNIATLEAGASEVLDQITEKGWTYG